MSQLGSDPQDLKAPWAMGVCPSMLSCLLHSDGNMETGTLSHWGKRLSHQLGLPMATLDGCSLDAHAALMPRADSPGGDCWHTWGSTDGPETSECEPPKVVLCVVCVHTPRCWDEGGSTASFRFSGWCLGHMVYKGSALHA